MTTARVKCGASLLEEDAAAFSRVELLSVLAVLALLAAIHLPALAHDKGNSHRAVCADNLRRLALSWLMYADDNRGRLAPNLGTAPSNLTNNWVGGVLDLSGPDNTNIATITQAKLYPYSRAVGIYRCPDDSSAARGQLRIRSYSMNAYVGDGTRGWTSGFQTMTNRSLVRQPDRTFVFIEEHSDSINDGLFVVDMSVSASFGDFPAPYHYLDGNLGFADGSVRHHEWLNIPTSLRPSFPRINGSDVTWLQNVTTYRK